MKEISDVPLWPSHGFEIPIYCELRRDDEIVILHASKDDKHCSISRGVFDEEILKRMIEVLASAIFYARYPEDSGRLFRAEARAALDGVEMSDRDKELWKEKKALLECSA